jgi:hypothetical protein
VIGEHLGPHPLIEHTQQGRAPQLRVELLLLGRAPFHDAAHGALVAGAHDAEGHRLAAQHAHGLVDEQPALGDRGATRGG